MTLSISNFAFNGDLQDVLRQRWGAPRSIKNNFQHDLGRTNAPLCGRVIFNGGDPSNLDNGIFGQMIMGHSSRHGRIEIDLTIEL